MNKVTTWQFSESQKTGESLDPHYRSNPEGDRDFGHRMYLENTLSSLVNKEKPLVDGPEARKSLEVLHAAYLSAERGEEIQLPLTEEYERLGRA